MKTQTLHRSDTKTAKVYFQLTKTPEFESLHKKFQEEMNAKKKEAEAKSAAEEKQEKEEGVQEQEEESDQASEELQEEIGEGEARESFQA
jgi:hypothetical protein